MLTGRSSLTPSWNYRNPPLQQVDLQPPIKTPQRREPFRNLRPAHHEGAVCDPHDPAGVVCSGGSDENAEEGPREGRQACQVSGHQAEGDQRRADGLPEREGGEGAHDGEDRGRAEDPGGTNGRPPDQTGLL